MKALKIIIVIILVILLYQAIQHIRWEIYKANAFKLDGSNLIVLSTRNGRYTYLKNGKNYVINFDGKWTSYFAENLFFVDEDTICFVLNNEIVYYNNGIIREINLNRKSIAVNKNKQGDLIVFSGGILYNYSYSKDSLEKLVDLIEDAGDHSKKYPSLYIHPNKIAYSEDRNSVFYSAYIDVEIRKKGIYEMSLEDFSINLVGEGFCPQIYEDNLYYISEDQSSVVKINLKGNKKEVVFEYSHSIRDISVIDDDNIFFAHAEERANIKGVKFDRYKIYINGKVKSVITNGEIWRSPIDVIRY
ncbi:MAG: hypothetical protein ACOC1O_03925 [bacterium]